MCWIMGKYKYICSAKQLKLFSCLQMAQTLNARQWMSISHVKRQILTCIICSSQSQNRIFCSTSFRWDKWQTMSQRGRSYISFCLDEHVGHGCTTRPEVSVEGLFFLFLYIHVKQASLLSCDIAPALEKSRTFSELLKNTCISTTD